MLDWFMNLPEWQIALLIVWIILQVLLLLVDLTEFIQKNENYPMIVLFFKEFKGIMVFHVVLFFLFLPYWFFCAVIGLVYFLAAYPGVWLFEKIERVMITPIYFKKKK
ncbi:hypothetical protein D3C87_1872480 [compost metagenome]